MRGHYALLVDADQNPRGIFQSYLKEVDGPMLVNTQRQAPRRDGQRAEVLHLLHTMKQVQAGTDWLNSTNFVYFNYDDGSYGLTIPGSAAPFRRRRTRAAGTRWSPRSNGA